jgi:hypothetical protein
VLKLNVVHHKLYSEEQGISGPEVVNFVVLSVDAEEFIRFMIYITNIPNILESFEQVVCKLDVQLLGERFLKLKLSVVDHDRLNQILSN